VQADLKARAGAESGGGRMRERRGKERREEEKLTKGRGADEAGGDAEEGGEGVFRSNPGVMAADYWGDFPICHCTSWAFWEPNLCGLGIHLW
jgi:hypothetical protein